MAQVFKFDEFLLERVDFTNQDFEEVAKKFNKCGMNPEGFKTILLSDKNTLVDEDGKIVQTGAYTNWVLYNNQVYMKGGNMVYPMYDTFFETVKADPTTVMKGDEIGRLGEYSKWMLHQYCKIEKASVRDRWEEDLYRITDGLRAYIANKTRINGSVTLPSLGQDAAGNDLPERVIKNVKDINSFKTVRDFLDFIDTLDGGAKSKTQEIKEIKSGANKLYEDENLLIVIPETKEAAMYYGANTRWCTAAESRNMFDHYNKKGELYIIIFKKEKDEKYQFHFETSQFMDSSDEGIDLEEFLSEHEIVRETLLKHIVGKIEKIKVTDSDSLAINDYVSPLVLLDTNLIYVPKLVKDGTINPLTLDLYLIVKLVEAKALEFSVLESYSKSKSKGNDDTVLFKDSKAYLVFTGFDDDQLLDFFEDDNREFAKSILNNDADPFDSGVSFDLSDAFDMMDHDNTIAIKKLIVKEGISKENDEGDEVEITMDNIDEFDLEDLLENEASFIVDEYMENAFLQANDAALESAYYEKYTDALIDKLGKYIWLEGDDRVQKYYYRWNKEKTEQIKYEYSHNLAFEITLKEIMEHYKTMFGIEEREDVLNYDLVTIFQKSLYEDSELISIDTRYDYVYGSSEDVKVNFNAYLSNNIPSDIDKPAPQKVDPSQLSLFPEDEETIKESRIVKSFKDFLKGR